MTKTARSFRTNDAMPGSRVFADSEQLSAQCTGPVIPKLNSGLKRGKLQRSSQQNARSKHGDHERKV
jgi:hypothetical protein